MGIAFFAAQNMIEQHSKTFRFPSGFCNLKHILCIWGFARIWGYTRIIQNQTILVLKLVVLGYRRQSRLWTDSLATFGLEPDMFLKSYLDSYRALVSPTAHSPWRFTHGFVWTEGISKFYGQKKISLLLETSIFGVITLGIVMDFHLPRFGAERSSFPVREISLLFD